jgi:hypothetical protein
LVAHAHISLSHLVKVGGQTAEFADGPGGKMKRYLVGPTAHLNLNLNLPNGWLSPHSLS